MIGTTFVIGHEPDFAPLTFLDGDESRGLVIEILVEAFGRIGITTGFAPVALPGQEAALQAGTIDAVAFKAVIAERAGDYDFSVPMMTSGAAWFVLAQGAPAGSAPAAASRLATPGKGPLIAQLRREYPDAAFPDVDTYAEALRAVVDGDADRAALNFHVGRYLAGRDHPGRFEMPAAPFSKIPLAPAFAKGRHAEIRGRFDRALAEMQSGGVVDAIERRWIAT